MSRSPFRAGNRGAPLSVSCRPWNPPFLSSFSGPHPASMMDAAPAGLGRVPERFGFYRTQQPADPSDRPVETRGLGLLEIREETRRPGRQMRVEELLLHRELGRRAEIAADESGH